MKHYTYEADKYEALGGYPHHFFYGDHNSLYCSPASCVAVAMAFLTLTDDEMARCKEIARTYDMYDGFGFERVRFEVACMLVNHGIWMDTVVVRDSIGNPMTLVYREGHPVSLAVTLMLVLRGSIKLSDVDYDYARELLGK